MSVASRRTALGVAAAALLVGFLAVAGVVAARLFAVTEGAVVSDQAVRVVDDDSASGTIRPLPGNAPFDYQIGSDYSPPAGTQVVARDWSIGFPLPGGYSICYVNAFQTQEDDPDVDRPDERSNWPADLVLTGFEDDPNWAGEYLIDLSTAAKRTAAADHLDQMIEVCAAKAFDAVEYDNLDSWTRLTGLPFGREESIAFAEIITDRAHALDMAVAQKNTSGLGAAVSLDVIGFDFAVVEECGAFDECDDVAAVFGDAIVVIEYSDQGFATACTTVGASVSVVRRDLFVTTPKSNTYVYDEC